MITWIASYPKSGNTWARLFLAHYHGWENPNKMGPFTYSDTSERHFDRVSPVAGRYDEYESYALKPAALLHMATELKPFGDRVWIKTHAANVAPGGLPQIPNELTTAAVYIVRDPRDVAVSYAYHMDKSIDQAIDEMANDGNALKSKNGIQQYMGSWSTHVKSWQSKATIVRYEDLPNAFETVLEGLGIEKTDRFDASVKATSFDRLKAFEKETGFGESVRDVPFFRKGKKGDWREVLTEEQAWKIWGTHKEMMQEYGYDD